MKIALSFMAGVAACSLLFFVVSLALPVYAGVSDKLESSDNTTTSLLGLLPDFEKIYHDALTMPFIKAESKIYDEDIAAYYRALMDETGLAPKAPQE